MANKWLMLLSGYNKPLLEMACALLLMCVRRVMATKINDLMLLITIIPRLIFCEIVFLQTIGQWMFHTGTKSH